jgi:hypothetical protein
MDLEIQVDMEGVPMVVEVEELALVEHLQLVDNTEV